MLLVGTRLTCCRQLKVHGMLPAARSAWRPASCEHVRVRADVPLLVPGAGDSCEARVVRELQVALQVADVAADAALKAVAALTGQHQAAYTRSAAIRCPTQCCLPTPHIHAGHELTTPVHTRLFMPSALLFRRPCLPGP
jgi:hypothetical protein